MEEIVKARKQNMKLYSLYRAISIDLFFYYAIEFLFLTQVKNISSADFVLGQAFYAIFMMILQIPASICVDKLGTKKCTTLANIFNSIFILLIMNCNNLGDFIVAQFVSSLCFSLKDISDSTLIHCSIPKSKKEGEIFSKKEGRAYKDYYLLNAVTYILSGFLYVVNPYIPLILSFCITILATIMSLGFKDLEEEKQKKSSKSYKEDFVKGIKFIFQSERLRSLFLYSGIAWGIFCLIATYRNKLISRYEHIRANNYYIISNFGISNFYGSKKTITIP